MRFSKKNIGIAVAVLILITASYFYKEYERKPADITHVSPAYKVDVATFVSQYEKDEVKANQLYLDKTIQVTGVITAINNQKDTLINVLIGDTNSMHKVSCMLDKNHLQEIKKYAIGQPIVLKGICTGFLIDIELNRCVIVQNNN